MVGRKEFLKMTLSLEGRYGNRGRGEKSGQQEAGIEIARTGQEMGEQECCRKGKVSDRPERVTGGRVAWDPEVKGFV